MWAGPSLDSLHVAVDAVGIPTTTASATLFFPVPCGTHLSEDDQKRFAACMCMCLCVFGVYVHIHVCLTAFAH